MLRVFIAGISFLCVQHRLPASTTPTTNILLLLIDQIYHSLSSKSTSPGPPQTVFQPAFNLRIMDDRHSRPRIPPTVNSAQSQDQDRYEPLPAVPRLILRCDNGVHVPLVIMPGSDSPGVVGRDKILVPDNSCGFGVVSFPRPHCASDFRRASSTSRLWSCETGPGASRGGKRFDMTNASLRSCDSDSASTSHAHHTAGSVVDKDGKIVSYVQTHP